MPRLTDQLPEEMQLDTGADLPFESPEDAVVADQVIAAKNTAEIDFADLVTQLAAAAQPEIPATPVTPY